MYPRSVSTTRRVHARLHTRKDGCLHTFWLTKSCLCACLNIWHLVCYVISHRCSRNRVPPHYFLTYERFSLWNFLLARRLHVQLCHRRTRLYATCDIFFYVLSRSACFHANVSTTRRVRVRVRALKNACVYFLAYEDMFCVTFNICQHVCHNRNDVQPHDITYEPFSVCNFSRTKSCLRTLVWPTRRTVMRVHCEKTSLYATFWLTWTCPHAHFLIAGRVCI